MLDTMLKHPQIINMEPFSKNKLTLTNLDDRITICAGAVGPGAEEIFVGSDSYPER